MSNNNTIIRFDNTSFQYDQQTTILDGASFSVRENSKITIMGQNGAGKSTIFKLILGAGGVKDDTALTPNSGNIHIKNDATIGIAKQVMQQEYLELSILDYFATAFAERPYNLEKQVTDVCDVVQLSVPLDKLVKDLSGGQQARLLLAHALIQKPDILLLDEPTNNLDADGIGHLITFLIMYEKTVIVISHDADFLNSFTDGVLHLDVYTKQVEQYVGNYSDVVEKIAAQIDREEKKNAQLRKNIQDRKDKVNFFANKGGKMRKLASKMRDEIADDEEHMVDVKRDDKTIRPFQIPAQPISEAVVEINEIHALINHTHVSKKVDISLWKNHTLHITGPNGIGKSTFLKELALGTHSGAKITDGVVVGYYRQDFSGLDFGTTVYEALAEMKEIPDNQEIYATGAQFLLTSDSMKNKVGSLSEGQKGLLCYARFVLQTPGLLILDEPTNHINFRHLPIIAKAIDDYEGTVILVSHMPEFVDQIQVTQELDLGRLA